MIVDLALGIAGLLVLAWRLNPFGERPLALTDAPGTPTPKVTVIVPCRNEAANIPHLLQSLVAIDYPDFEVLVVDDSSTDQTAQLARAAGVKVIDAGPKPEGWSGKNWACWQGAQRARGDLLVFTDADTFHLPDSLRRVVSFLDKNQTDMISAPPFHRANLAGESVLGFFHLLPMIATAAFQSPRSDRLFAIGQYLAFTRAAYDKIGGHFAIAKELVDDIMLAKACLNHGCKYGVLTESVLYEVQMFASWKHFIAGWTRLLRLGIGSGGVLPVVEIVLIFHLFLKYSVNPAWIGLQIAALAVIGLAQVRAGRFSVWGLPLVPFNILVFTLITLKALVDKLRGQAIQWRDRAY